MDRVWHRFTGRAFVVRVSRSGQEIVGYAMEITPDGQPYDRFRPGPSARINGLSEEVAEALLEAGPHAEYEVTIRRVR